MGLAKRQHPEQKAAQGHQWVFNALNNNNNNDSINKVFDIITLGRCKSSEFCGFILFPKTQLSLSN